MPSAMGISDKRPAVRRPCKAVTMSNPELQDAGLFFRYYGSAFHDVVISLCVPCREFVAAATSMELLMAVERQHVCTRDRR